MIEIFIKMWYNKETQPEVYIKKRLIGGMFFHCYNLQIKIVFLVNHEYYNTTIYVCQYVFNVSR